MISLYSGTPGSGKSLHMAKAIYYWLSAGHPCIANFEIDVAKIKHCKGSFYYLDNLDLTPQNLINFSRVYFRDHKFKEGALRLYIDECQLIFNAREWQEEGRSDWLSFYTQHRKYGYDIILVAQFDRMIDRQIRSLIEYQYIHRKVDNFGIGGLIVKILMLGHPVFCCNKYWYPIGQRLSSEFFLASKKYYSIYDTLNTFDDFKNEALSGAFKELTPYQHSDQDEDLEEENTDEIEEKLS